MPICVVNMETNDVYTFLACSIYLNTSPTNAHTNLNEKSSFNSIFLPIKIQNKTHIYIYIY